MGIKCGIVGLPNVGKSTLFNAVTQAQNAAAANYPFCTIDPNVGVVPVPDLRLKALADIAKPEKVLPTTIEFVDIAGLVAGASKGEGLGNKFLAHIRETDAIAQVVRCFVNDDIVHVAGRIDPLSDIEVINTELALADLETVERGLQRAEKAAKTGDKDAIRLREILKRMRDHLDAGNPARTLELDAADRPLLRELHLITIKPLMYVANVAENGFKDNPYLDIVQKRADAEGADVVPVCAAIESEIAELEPADRQAFLEELGLHEPGLDRVIRAAYHLLGLLTFFTVGAQGSPRLDHAQGRAGAAGRRRDPHRLREGLHPRRGDLLRGFHRLQGRAGRQGSREDAARGQGVRRPRGRRDALPIQRVDALLPPGTGAALRAAGEGGSLTRSARARKIRAPRLPGYNLRQPADRPRGEVAQTVRARDS